MSIRNVYFCVSTDGSEWAFNALKAFASNKGLDVFAISGLSYRKGQYYIKGSVLLKALPKCSYERALLKVAVQSYNKYILRDTLIEVYCSNCYKHNIRVSKDNVKTLMALPYKVNVPLLRKLLLSLFNKSDRSSSLLRALINKVLDNL